jgi:hypothetical protein
MSYHDIVFQDSPLADLRLGDALGSTTAVDSTGNGYTGTIHGGVTLGIYGAINNDPDTAMAFDGTSGYIILPGTLATSGWSAFTAECWFNASSVSGVTCIMGNSLPGSTNVGFAMVIISGTLYFEVGNGATNANVSVAIVVNQWYHAVLTYDGATLTGYLTSPSGAFIGTHALAGTIGTTTNAVIIGATNSGVASNFFHGTIDEVAMNHAVLNQARVNCHYQAGEDWQSPSLNSIQLFPTNNIWNTPIDLAPVHPNSSTYMGSIGGYLVPNFGHSSVGMPYITVDNTVAKVTVDFSGGYPTYSDVGPYPIPEWAPMETPNDLHMLILHTSELKLYELWDVVHLGVGSWSAGAGAIWDLTSNAIRPPGWLSADAAGCPMLQGLVRYDEVSRGVIGHALRGVCNATQNTYLWPATHEAGVANSALPPMGLRIRLKSAYDTSYFPPQSRVILNCLKRYGLIIADNGGGGAYLTLSGAPDERWDLTDLNALRSVLTIAGNFECLDESGLQVASNSAQSVSIAPNIVTVANKVVSVRDHSVVIQDALAQRSTCDFTVLDPAGTARIVDYSAVSVTDNTNTNLFTGVVFDATNTNLYPNPNNDIAVTCADNEYFAGKHYFGVKADGTTDKEKINQYAGNIAVELLHDYLAQEGITAAYAFRRDSTTTDWNTGNLTNVVAAANLDDGDLELALAGSVVSIVENTTAEFGTGTLSGVTDAANALIPTPTQAVKLVAICSQPGSNNAYCYIKIWTGSHAIGANESFSYDVWILPSSPSGQMAVDVVFTDGTTFRDTAASNGIVDVQYILPHPSNDVGPMGIGQWYHRSFYWGAYNGKSVQSVMVACEGNNVGTYTAYFKNIQFNNAPFSFTQNTTQHMQRNGYSYFQVSTVNTYDLSGATRGTPAYSIDAAKLLKSSFVTWQAVEPVGTLFQLKCSYDGGTVYQTCTRNAPLPNLPAGSVLAGKSVLFSEQFIPDPAVTGNNRASPEYAPTLKSLEVTIQPSYNATKSDVVYTVDANSAWAAGTFTNTTNGGGNVLGLKQFIRNWDDGDTSNQTLWSTSSSGTSADRQFFHMFVGASASDARSQCNFAGNLTDGTVEVDILVDNATTKPGITYRTTHWENANNTFGYAIEVDTAKIGLYKSSNSSTPSITNIGGLQTLNISSGNWHRLKSVFVGSNHKVYLDDVLYLNVTDGTFTAAGNVALRVENSSGAQYLAFFDNFGSINAGAALTGQWLSPNQSLASAALYGSSVISWRDLSTDAGNTNTVLVETQVDGSTWHTATNGGTIAGLTVGQNLSAVNLRIRVTLTTTTATTAPQIDRLVARVLGQFNATGTRISPVLSLSPVGRVGNSLVAWNAALATGTTLGVDTSPDAVTWTNVPTSGSAIPGYIMQPDPYYDTFAINSLASFSSTFDAGGGVATWAADTANSRITSTGGSEPALIYTGFTQADMFVEADLDQSSNGGLECRRVDHNNLYALYIYDASSASGTPNTFQLDKIVGGAYTLLATGAIVFPRGNLRRFRLSTIGSVISATVDGTLLASITDTSITSAGMAGLIGGTGNCGGRFYSVRVQPLGDDLTGKNVYTRLRLGSTDPTVTPQVLDLTVSAHDPDIGVGALIPVTAWDWHAGNLKTIVDCFDDLCAKSQSPAPFAWTIDKNKKFKMKAHTATPAPFVLATVNGDYLVAGLQLYNNSPSYRNGQRIVGGTDTATQTEYRLGDSQTQSWSMGYPLAAPLPTTAPLIVTVDGVKQSVGVRGTDTGKVFYYQIGSTQITQDASLAPPAGLQPNGTPAQVVAFTYLGQVPVDSYATDSAAVSALAAIEGGSGIVEMIESVPGLNKAASDALALAHLSQYKVRGQSFTYDTLRSGLAVGQITSVWSPELGLSNSQCLVSSIKTTLMNVSTATQPSGIQPWYEIVLITGPLVGEYTRFFAKVIGAQTHRIGVFYNQS